MNAREASAAGDQVRVSVLVRVPLATAFEIFTSEIDSWWRRGPKFRQAGTRAGIIHIDPQVDGRVFESIEDENGPRILEIGHISVWEPPHRLAFSWRNATFGPAEITQVEVQFRATGSGTTVEVTHRGWASVRPEHPARHGLDEVAFARMLGLWWGEQLAALRERVLQQSNKGGAVP
jgi:uncharacterized protein YndB with AHSA1/START domain